MNSWCLPLMLVCIVSAAAVSSPIDGTWRIDLKQTQPSEKPQTYLLQNGRYSCPTCDPPIEIKADGQDQPVSGSPYIDSLNVRVVDDKTLEVSTKKNGKTTSSSKGTLTDGGNRLTVVATNYPEGSASPVTGTYTLIRTEKAPVGAHAQSGSWRFEKAEGVSDNALLFTYTSTDNGLSYSTPTGESYAAKFDGQDYPYKGNPGVTSVVIKRIDDRTVEETGKREGTAVYVQRMTVSNDGQSMNIVNEDKRRGTTDKYVAKKQ